MTETLTIAVCICNGVTLSDFVPTIEIFAAVNMIELFPAKIAKDVKFRFAVDYLATTKEPVHALSSMQITVNPTRTFGEVLNEAVQYDIIWIPAGPLAQDPTGSLENTVPAEQIKFIRQQAPKAKYILAASGGAVQLALAGLLDGKRATTTKAFYKTVVGQMSNKIQWVAKARWVVDGNIWTSSGVSAGSDMALAFLEHLTSKEFAQAVRCIVEIIGASNSEDDPFAAIHGLV